LRKVAKRSDLGALNTCSGGADFDDFAFVHEHHGVRDFARKAHFVRDHDHRHTGPRQFDHYIQDFGDHFGIKG